jgi:hypothetical protein
MTTRNGILTISTFVSAMLFPWPLTVLLALAASFLEPLVPFAAGLFTDTLYYVPHAGSLPTFTLYGLAASIIAVLVRRRLRTSPIR